MILYLLKGGEQMYMKNLKNVVTLRLDDNLKSFIGDISSKMGLSPSAFIRMTLYSLMCNMERENLSDADIKSD